MGPNKIANKMVIPAKAGICAVHSPRIENSMERNPVSAAMIKCRTVGNLTQSTQTTRLR